MSEAYQRAFGPPQFGNNILILGIVFERVDITGFFNGFTFLHYTLTGIMQRRRMVWNAFHL
jgi:hypothetical protein